MSDKLSTIALDLIEPAEDNLRAELTGIRELADSIAFIGLMEPIRVFKDGDIYRVIAGHRRLAALRINGEVETKAIVESGKPSDMDRTAAMLIENMQRVDLDVAEQAEGVRRLITDHGMSQADVSTNLGASKDWVKDRLAILNVPETALAEYSPGHRLSVKHLALLGSLDEDRRERLLKKSPVPSQYDIENAWNKQMSVAQAERVRTKLTKDGYLAITEKDLKRLLKAETASLSGNDMVIKQILGAAERISNGWEMVKLGETVVILTNIHGIEKRELKKNTVYVVKSDGGFHSWYELSKKSGQNAGNSEADEEEADWEKVRAANDARRKAYDEACATAEMNYVATAKPAELISQVLSAIVHDAAHGYSSPSNVLRVLQRLGLEYADIDGEGIDQAIRRENVATNQATLLTHATKNSANLARTAATIKLLGHGYSNWKGIEYPEAPQYEGYANEDDDEYDDEEEDEDPL